MSSEGKKLTGLKKAMAKQMIRSWTDVPQFQLSTTVRCDQLIAYRKDLATKVSFTTIIAKAVAIALSEFPEINQRFVDGLVESVAAVNVGIASDTKRGLLVPVINQVDTKSLAAIQNDLNQIKEQSKTGKFSMEELTGGTFTISNLGMFNIETFSSIVNTPELGILAIGKIAKKPYVDENDQLIVASVLQPVLTLDHRVADGATGARFLTRLAEILENPNEQLPKK
ncbi:2-oxo acid dehydrogenase subunit E2 [Candidatus Enterococcus ferrettii]|uniref:Pyruvate dehydrogenase E2 component (Dihydrolipoamide acetyltransferase) n=1 Tax=Candidatus Enterococcus ferrettii TaxID=2815324 RepID=A0ABV0EIC7_9ENTE|nr:2-oxo acid dehydrogenase subunit E2 [Enterococcus sp. 665A]MBO1341823.1 2-oxo acid dehydrogenase subunit E2 [Enterococcus sp. 665A]